MRQPPSFSLLAWLADPAPSATAAAVEAPKHPWLDWWKGLPGRVLFENWEAGVFERSFWESFMHGFWVTLALATALLMIFELWVPQFGARVPGRLVRRISIGLTVLGFFSYFSFLNSNVRSKDFYNQHEFYHAYLGSKYSEELGYTRLYECTAVAEIELGKDAALKTKEMRDLSEPNTVVPIAKSSAFNAPDRCKEHFSTERWEAFRSDVAWFEASARGPTWDRMKLDRGYAATPAWSLIGKFFASWVPASDTSLKWLAALDVVLQAATLGLIAWGFGWRSAALASVFWACNAVGTFAWTGGAFLRQDWLFLLVASMACARRGKPLLSGAAITLAVLLRVFPVIAMFGYVVLMLSHWLRHRSLSRVHQRFLAGCAVTLALLVPASLVSAGTESYQEFADYTALHGDAALAQDMGLPVIFAHDWAGRLRFSRDDGMGDAALEAWKIGRQERIEETAWLSWLGALGIAAWSAWALARMRSFWLAIPLSVPLFVAVTHLPCYTYAAFIALAPLVLLHRSFGPLLMVLAALSQVLLERLFWVDDRYTALTYLFGAASLLCLWGCSRWPSVAAVSALFQRPPTPTKS